MKAAHWLLALPLVLRPASGTCATVGLNSGQNGPAGPQAPIAPSDGAAQFLREMDFRLGSLENAMNPALSPAPESALPTLPIDSLIESLRGDLGARSPRGASPQQQAARHTLLEALSRPQKSLPFIASALRQDGDLGGSIAGRLEDLAKALEGAAPNERRALMRTMADLRRGFLLEGEGLRASPGRVEAYLGALFDGGRGVPLAEYIQASMELPEAFNVLALRDFQRKAGLPRFSKLDPRFSASFKAIYGPKGSDQLARSIGSPIETTLGTGWMGRIVSLKDGRIVKTIIREGSRTSKIGILFETEAWMTYQLQKNQDRYGIKVLPIIVVGPDGMYLEKPFIDSRNIGKQILKRNKKLSPIQLRRLRRLHQNAIRLAEETGIPLDLKADNVFWDGSDWVFFDPVGSINLPTSYGKTLDARDFDDFYLKWAKKKPVGEGLTIDRVVRLFPRIRKDYEGSNDR